MSSPKEPSRMEVSEEDVLWYMEDFNLDRETVLQVLDALDPGCVKDEFWKANPTVPEAIVDDVVRKNISSSLEYHQYRTFNNEAS